MKTRLYGHLGVKKTYLEGMEGRGWAIHITFTIIFDSFIKVTKESRRGSKSRENFLLPEAPESRIH